uniref:NADH dehydrogenase subunit 4L n=1 Tax=Imerinia grandidieri TaxID=3244470 RepID=G8HQX5_9EUPU|nr:NADH dehydrogenase subunit 4L [Rhopalocaulis grandidieri]
MAGSLMLILIMLMISTFNFIIQHKSPVKMLVSLEALMLSSLIFFMNLSLVTDLLIMMLILAAAEAAIGLSTLSSLLMISGKESLTSNSFFF